MEFFGICPHRRYRYPCRGRATPSGMVPRTFLPSPSPSFLQHWYSLQELRRDVSSSNRITPFLCIFSSSPQLPPHSPHLASALYPINCRPEALRSSKHARIVAGADSWMMGSRGSNEMVERDLSHLANCPPPPWDFLNHYFYRCLRNCMTRVLLSCWETSSVTDYPLALEPHQSAVFFQPLQPPWAP